MGVGELNIRNFGHELRIYSYSLFCSLFLIGSLVFIKGIVHPKLKMLSFTHPRVIPNLKLTTLIFEKQIKILFNEICEVSDPQWKVQETFKIQKGLKAIIN